MKLQSNELLEQQKVTQDLQIKFTELQSEIIPKQFEVSKLTQEKEYLQKELDFHRQQLLSKENEERRSRQENFDKITKLEAEIHSVKHSFEEAKNKIAVLTVRPVPSTCFLPLTCSICRRNLPLKRRRFVTIFKN